MKKYCDGLDCAWCNEKEPCIYRIANNLEEQLQAKEQECKALREEKAYTDMACEQLKKQLDQLKTELEQTTALKDTYFACYHAKHEDLAKKYELLKKCYKNNLTLLDYEEANTTKLVNKVMKLEKTLTEIEEIAEYYDDTYNLECKQLCCTEILQKIKEMEE